MKKRLLGKLAGLSSLLLVLGVECAVAAKPSVGKVGGGGARPSAPAARPAPRPSPRSKPQAPSRPNISVTKPHAPPQVSRPNPRQNPSFNPPNLGGMPGNISKPSPVTRPVQPSNPINKPPVKLPGDKKPITRPSLPEARPLPTKPELPRPNPLPGTKPTNPITKPNPLPGVLPGERPTPRPLPTNPITKPGTKPAPLPGVLPGERPTRPAPTNPIVRPTPQPSIPPGERPNRPKPLPGTKPSWPSIKPELPIVGGPNPSRPPPTTKPFPPVTRPYPPRPPVIGGPHPHPPGGHRPPPGYPGWNNPGWGWGGGYYPGWNHSHWNDYWHYQHVHNHYHNWYNGCWHTHWGGYWNSPWAVPIALGTTYWGWSRINTWGYAPVYYNPYYVTPVVGTAPSSYDYSQTVIVNNYAPDSLEDPLPSDTPPAQLSAEERATRIMEEAINHFKEGDYTQAIARCDFALALSPGDPVIHEVRALALFATQKYQPAAAALHSLLAVAPGMDWTSMSNLYPSNETYTQQLRALEAHCKANKTDGGAAFVLAYHYMVLDEDEAARRTLQTVIQLQPKDAVAQRLLDSLDEDDDAKPMAEAVTDDENAPQTNLVGKWRATSEETTIELTLDDKSNFTWKATLKGQPTAELSGEAAVSVEGLALESADQGTMAGKVKSLGEDKFQFVLVGAPSTDPGLTFERVK